MPLQCPNCRSSLQLDRSTPSEVTTCETCGETFGLVDETLDVQRGIADVESGANLSFEQAASRFGKFKLLERVGAGSFGTVWKARDVELDRLVALKIPRGGQVADDQVEPFLKEAQAAAQLQHPHIVSVHELCREGDFIGLVSDFVDGRPLDEQIADAALDQTAAIDLCIQICEALEHAHGQGVIHRDLKPANVMIDAAGSPRVMDFGLAKRVAATDVTMTVEGRILGTPAYMPPEQARGEGFRADARADVYSLGVMLFELLTGERPFRGNLRDVIRQVLEVEAPSPRQLNSRVSKDLETICLKCLEKSADRRYATAAHLRKDLECFRRGEPISARPITKVDRTWRWCRRKPLVAGLSAALMLVLIGVAVAGPIVAWNANRLRAAAEQEAAKSRAINDFILLDMLAAPNPYEGQGHQVTVSETLDFAESRIAERFQNEPEIEGALRFVVSRTYNGLGESLKAMEQAESAWKIQKATLGANHPDTLASQVFFCSLLTQNEKHERAEATLRDAIPRLEEHLGEHDSVTISARISLGAVLQILERFDESDPLLMGAINDQEQYQPAESDQAAKAISSLAASLFARQEWAEAEKWLNRMLEIAVRDGLPEAKMMALNLLALVNASTERYEEALRIQTKLLAEAEAMLPPGHWHLAVIRHGQAASLLKLGREQEAIPILITAYHGMRDALGRDNWNTVKLIAEIVNVAEKNELSDVLDAHREPHMYTWLRTANRNELDKVERGIDLYLAMKRREEPFPLAAFHDELVAHRSHHLPEGHERRGQYASNVGSWLLAQKEFSLAEPWLVEGFETWPGNADDEEHASWAREQMCMLYAGLGKAKEAKKYE